MKSRMIKFDDIRVFISPKGAAVAFSRIGTPGESPIPCGCAECSHGAQPGHAYCAPSPAWALQMERSGLIVRAYDDGAWRWFEV